MPTPLTRGNVNFQEREVSRRKSRRGIDGLTVVLRGATSLLAVEEAKWTKGRTYPGYPTMFLEEINVSDKGVVSDIELSFSGFLTPPQGNGLVDVSRDVSLSSVQLSSSGGDNVSVNYYSQSTTFRWLADFPNPRPRFRNLISVPVDFPPGAIFNFSPPRFSGSLGASYKVLARLNQFQISELGSRAYSVTESWGIEIEPV